MLVKKKSRKLTAVVICNHCGQPVTLDYQAIRKVVAVYGAHNAKKQARQMSKAKRLERAKLAAATRWKDHKKKEGE